MQHRVRTAMPSTFNRYNREPLWVKAMQNSFIRSILMLCLLGLICLAISTLAGGPRFLAHDEIVFTVDKVMRDQGQYLIWTTNGEVLQNVDELLAGKFNSSDVQAKINAGKRYRAEVWGWRVPLFSWYRNIIWVQEVKK